MCSEKKNQWQITIAYIKQMLKLKGSKNDKSSSVYSLAHRYITWQLLSTDSLEVSSHIGAENTIHDQLSCRIRYQVAAEHFYI